MIPIVQIFDRISGVFKELNKITKGRRLVRKSAVYCRSNRLSLAPVHADL